MRYFDQRAHCLVAIFVLLTASRSSTWSDDLTSTVGMPSTIEQLVLPGTELRVRPMENRNAPFVLRIVESYPHGTDRRYDLEYYALEPGTYDLADYLERVDRSDSDDLPEVIVKVRSTLPEGQVMPTPPDETRLPSMGGYRLWGVLAASLWVAGLVALIFVGRTRSTKTVESIEPELSAIDRLRPLISAARGGTLEADQHAELERSVIAFWRDELQLNDLPPSELLVELRENDDSGPMLNGLERWLHSPDADPSVDLNELLQPIDQRLDALQASREALATS